MPFAPNQEAYIRDWVNEQRGGICGQQHWDTWAIESIGVLRAEAHTTDFDPFIAFVCQKCGRVVWLDPNVLLLPPASP